MPNVSMTLPNDYSGDAAALERQRKYAEMLQQQAMQPLEAPHTAPGGLAVPVSWTQALAKVMQGYSAGKMRDDVDEKQKALSAKAQADLMNTMDTYSRIAGGTPAQPGGVESIIDETAAGGEGAPATITTPSIAAVPGDERKAAMYLTGSQHPVAASLGAKLMAELIKPEKFGHEAKFDAEGKPYLVGDKGTIRRPNDPSLTPREKLAFQSLGDQVVGLDPVTGQPRVSMTTGMSPSQLDHATRWRFEHQNPTVFQTAELGQRGIRLRQQEAQLGYETGRTSTPMGGFSLGGGAAPPPIGGVAPQSAPRPAASNPTPANFPRERAGGDNPASAIAIIKGEMQFAIQDAKAKGASQADIDNISASFGREITNMAARARMSPEQIAQIAPANITGAPAAGVPADRDADRRLPTAAAQPVLPPRELARIEADKRINAQHMENKRDFTMQGLNQALNEAEAILKGKAGSKPTSSMIGAGVDWLGSTVGVSPTGAPEADRMRAIGAALVSKMPRMEGPQSNLDVQLYKESAGQIGDATIPLARRLAALDTVRTLYSKYEKMNQTPAGAGLPAGFKPL